MDIRLVVPGLPIATPDPFAAGLGGSETAGLQLARALARRGTHRVIAFCHRPTQARWQGVTLAPIDGYVESAAARAGDMLLIQRESRLLTLGHTAKFALLWLHDQAGPHMASALTAALPAVDRLVMVSAWQAQQHREIAPGLSGEQILVARNGIDLDLIAAGVRGAGERDPHRILYTSRPERGLEVLLEHVFPRILAKEPRATLHLATYDCPDPALEPYHRRLAGVAERFGDRIVVHGALGKRELYRLMATSGVCLYPTPAPGLPSFAETSCITAMEAMACGLPWISTDRGALAETVGDAGVLVPIGDGRDAASGDIPERLAAEALRVMHDQEHAEWLRAAGLERAAGLGWNGVADELLAVAGEHVMQKSPGRRVAQSPATEAVIPTSRRPAPVSAAPAQPKQPSVMIATPVYGSVHPHFVQSLLATSSLLRQQGIGVGWMCMPGDSLVSRARNNLAAMILSRPEIDRILWIDADIGWQAEDVLRLLAHDVDVVCGLCPRKQHLDERLPIRFAFKPLKAGNHEASLDPATGLMEIAAGGTGFMLTKRSVYERLAQAFPEAKIKRSSQMEGWPDALLWLHQFFPTGLTEDGDFLAEDWGFCRRWQQIGGRMWADPAVQLTHYGEHAYTGNPLAMFEPAQITHMEHRAMATTVTSSTPAKAATPVDRPAPVPAAPAVQSKRPAVVICTPSYANAFPSQYVISLTQTLTKLPAAGVWVRWMPRCGDALLPMARNWLAAQALADPECTHVLWIDSDLAWEVDDVLRLLRHDVDLAAAVYRTKAPEVRFDFEPLPGATTDPTTGLLEVAGVGTGFMLIKREAFMRLIEAYPESRISKGAGIYYADERALPWLHDHFPLGFQGDTYVSEDFAFCRRWRAIGGRIWVDLGIQLTHFTAVGLDADPMAELGRPKWSSFGGKAA